MSMASRFAIAAAAALTMTAGQAVQSAKAYEVYGRWSTTATDGSGLGQGDPTTLTWSFLADGVSMGAAVAVAGESTDSSSLISFLDTNFGAGPGGSDLTQRPWFDIFQDSYDRLEELSGLTFVYEPNDDGASFSGTPGSLGVRGDMRLGGHSVDGQGGSNILAYNWYPNNGDMVIDTDNATYFSSQATGFRNVLMHETMHGLGVEHIESSDASFLLEPFISTTFYGPQLDDVLALQRVYGDVYEKNGGNDTPETATDFGIVNHGDSVILGTAGDSTVITAGETDFLSVDGTSDQDFFRFEITSPAKISAILAPKGTTYQVGPQGGSQSELDTTALNDLVLGLFGSDTNLPPLTSSDGFGAGGTESILDFELASAGEYFLHVWGWDDDVQLYQIELSVVTLPEPSVAMLLGLGVFGGLLRRRRCA